MSFYTQKWYHGEVFLCKSYFMYTLFRGKSYFIWRKLSGNTVNGFLPCNKYNDNEPVPYHVYLSKHNLIKKCSGIT